MNYDRAVFEDLTYPLFLRLRELQETFGWQYLIRLDEPEIWVWTKVSVVQVRWVTGEHGHKFVTFASTGERYESNEISGVIEVVVSEIFEAEESQQ